MVIKSKVINILSLCLKFPQTQLFFAKNIMSQKFLFIIDPLISLKIKKDATLYIIKACQSLGIETYICETHHIGIQKEHITITAQKIHLHDDYRILKQNFADISPADTYHATDFNIIFMRKDPPVDEIYMTATYLLSLAELQNVRVVNPPKTLRNYNEKLFALEFPQFIPEYCFSASENDLRYFAKEYSNIILKPIDGMGGRGIFMTRYDDPNFSVIYETLSHYGKRAVFAQRFLPEITHGDKRIFMSHGEPYDYALARIPTGASIRGNLVSGGHFEARPLSKRDCEIATVVGQRLKEEKIDLCGIDIIGDYLTEINITSAGCFTEISDATNTNLALKYIEKYL